MLQSQYSLAQQCPASPLSSPSHTVSQSRGPSVVVVVVVVTVVVVVVVTVVVFVASVVGL